MQKSNVNGALREAQQAHHETILQGPKKQIHSIVFEDIDEDLVKKAAMQIKGG